MQHNTQTIFPAHVALVVRLFCVPIAPPLAPCPLFAERARVIAIFAAPKLLNVRVYNRRRCFNKIVKKFHTYSLPTQLHLCEPSETK